MGWSEIELDSVVLPMDIFHEVEYLVRTDAQVEDSVDNRSAIAAKDVTEKKRSMMAVPLPAYLQLEMWMQGCCIKALSLVWKNIRHGVFQHKH